MDLNADNCGDVSRLRKKNVLGCYLSRKLPNVRFCLTVFYKATELIYPWSKGKFRQINLFAGNLLLILEYCTQIVVGTVLIFTTFESFFQELFDFFKEM
jgi:hypothetical protein